MPDQNQNRGKEPIVDAMAECVFPEEIMQCILTRLPVKSLLRFKSVCKPWCKLFSTQMFIKMHHHQLCSEPKNEAFFIYNLSDYDVESMSLYNIESNAEKPTSLDIPYHRSFLAMYSVGCCNGLVCIGFIFLPGIGMALWNPALRLSKLVALPEIDYRVTKKISLGFGYDAEADDFKMVEIVCPREKKMGVVVEVYSSKSDSWETIKLDFQFRVLQLTNDAIVNGNPYWIAKREENESLNSYESYDVLVWCEVSKLKLKMVPLLTLKPEEGAKVQFVDWKGSLAALACCKNEERVRSIGVWVFDNVGMIWRKNHTFGPIEMKVDSLLQCSRDRKIMGECIDGKLFVYDPETGCVKVIEIDEARKRTFHICGYNESLVYIKGMEQVVVKKKEEVEEEDKPIAGRRAA